MEFSPDTNEAAIDPLDKQIAEAIQPVVKLVGKADELENNKRAVLALDQVIQKHPMWPDTLFFRATLKMLAASDDRVGILRDIDGALSLRRSNPRKTMYGVAEMYAVRAKVDLLGGDLSQAMADLEAALTASPDDARQAFNTGGVKPEDGSNPTALTKQDLDSLVGRFPNDYRAHMFRGLFYLRFSTFDEQYYASATESLQRASRLNPQAALVKFFLGTSVQASAFWTKAAASDTSDLTGARGGFKERSYQVAAGYFREAVSLDARFSAAHAHLADALYNLKKYPEAIAAFDKVIELDPENAAAYNDRGLAKAFSGDTYGAIGDFSKAIHVKGGGSRDTLDLSFENRGDAYVKVGNYDAAIKDYGSAIGLKLASMLFILRLPQLRAMYPEFKAVADHDLVEGFRQKYFPGWNTKAFADAYATNEKPYEEFVIAGVYVKRGDAYLRAKHFRTADGEYTRANKIYSHATEFDRWKIVSSTPESEFTIDTQTLDFSQGNVVSFWVKNVPSKSPLYRQDNYEIDCSGRRLRVLASMSYDAKGNVVDSRPGTDWQRVVPETIGEMFYSGACR